MNTKVQVGTEELRRAIGLSPDYTVKAAVVNGDKVEFELESHRAVGVSPNKVRDLNQIMKVINNSIQSGKEIRLEYLNENKSVPEITDRRFLPNEWVNEVTVGGTDLEINQPRRFRVDRIAWVQQG